MVLQTLGQNRIDAITRLGNQCCIGSVRRRLIERRANDIDPFFDRVHETDEQRQERRDGEQHDQPEPKRYPPKAFLS